MTSTFEPRELKPARGHSPRVFLRSGPDGRPEVVKSYAHCPWYLRASAGRLAIRGERWALERLTGSGHSPKLYPGGSSVAVVMEYLEGRPLEEVPPRPETGLEVFAQAQKLLTALEKAGVVHADLGHDSWDDWGRESNLIWTDDGQLIALDFSSSLRLRSTGGGPLGRFSRLLHRHDRLILTKIAHRFGLPLSMVPEDDAHPRRFDESAWNLLHFMGKV